MTQDCPADTWRNDNVIITSKRRRFDVMMTLLLRRMSAGQRVNIMPYISMMVGENSRECHMMKVGLKLCSISRSLHDLSKISPKITASHPGCPNFLSCSAFAWASYQIRKIAGSAWGMPGTFFFHHRGLAIPTCNTASAWRIPGSLTGGFLWSRWRGNVPGIPGAWATHNFAYLVKGPSYSCQIVIRDFLSKGPAVTNEVTMETLAK